MKLKLLIAGLVAAASLAPARAEEPANGNLVVVELFTSQGCSSCPPADALLDKLASRDDVLALALHVDYWDYIGWPDSFARPEHTKRQKAYARVAGSRTIYTPQMVIAGIDQIVGTRPMEVADAVMEHMSRPGAVALEVERSGGTLRISAPEPDSKTGTLVLQVVRFNPEKVVEILRGENAGKTLAYTNIVTGWKVVGEWAGDAPLRAEIPVAGEDAIAVLLQESGPGRIVAAAKLP